MGTEEGVFGKSLANKRVENKGLSLLLQDPRFQAPPAPVKRAIIELLPAKGAFGIQTFDAIMTPEPAEEITPASLETSFDRIRLIEMKTTKKPIASASLNGFFFGATEREYEMARALGDKYVFAFVVLNEQNEFGRPFFVLLTLEEVERRTRSKRIQYQVNFRTDIVPDPASLPQVGPLVLRAAEEVQPYEVGPTG